MQIAFALIAVFWWIAIWNLMDIMVEDWSREQQIKLYVAMLVGVAVAVFFFPDMLIRL
jgi:hypothetical protein